MTQTRDLREQAARCLTMVLEGKVSLDHFLVEYASAQDPQVREVREEVVGLCRQVDRYSRPATMADGSRKQLELLAARLRGR